mgnify:CR=1 FL=1|tara:strand:+ start:1117 stop:1305 length:189 start_codon:yes stop_codon:yes gene_type:complete
MNNILLSFGLIFLIIITGSVIGKFFDVREDYYLPFLLWGVALCLFNLILDKKKSNIYMKDIK